jgi:tetratricopeptide (TPR) repeat protein
VITKRNNLTSLAMGLISKIKTYHRWWRAWGTLPVENWVKAAAYYRSGKYQQAIEEYRNGVAQYPNHPARISAQLDLAYCLFRSASLEDAQDELRTILARDLNNREAYLRLAHIQLWTGQGLEAAWTMHRAMQQIEDDSEIVGIFLYALVTHGGAPHYLLNEAIKASAKFDENDPKINIKLKVAKAIYRIRSGEEGNGLLDLEELAEIEGANREAVLAYAQALIDEGKIAQGRVQLRRLINGANEHPRALSLMAETYLKSGVFYNCDYAVQLAVSACQKSGWLSAREMHVLAEGYHHAGDKVAALLVASKAKEAGAKLLGAYSEENDLTQLIESLSTGTLA